MKRVLSFFLVMSLVLSMAGCLLLEPADTLHTDPSGSLTGSQPQKTDPTQTEQKPPEPESTHPSETETNPTKPKPTEPAPTEPKPTEPTPTEPTPTEPKPTESTPTEPVPTEPETDGIVFITWPKTISRNEEGTVTIKGAPNTKYTIKVYYKSGPSTAKGLEDQVSNADGYVTWSWKVGSRTAAGDYKIVVSGGGESETVEYSVVE